MNRRCFLALAGVASVTREITVKQPICADNLKEILKAEEIPGYVPRAIAWANTNIFTGEWDVCDDDDPIYEDRFLNEFYGPERKEFIRKLLGRPNNYDGPKVKSNSAGRQTPFIVKAGRSYVCPQCLKPFVGIAYWYHAKGGVCCIDTAKTLREVDRKS